jgi:primosomal protein N' (replication factor Y)
MSIVRVALDVPLPTLFDYTVDEAVVAGQRVIVPFRRREMVGVVMECVETTGVPLDRRSCTTVRHYRLT